MNSVRIPYGHQSIDESDRRAVDEILRGDRLTQGPTIAAFEQAVADRVDADHAVAFTNATAALHGAASVAGLGPGDVVATSPLTFIASANCARYVGAVPVLTDIDLSTLNLDPRGVSTEVDGLVAVHYAGLPVDLTSLPARPRVVIEDAAQALGARTPDGPVGGCAHSDLTVFSFHPVKPITTGEGGLVTTNSDEMAEALRRFRNHGMVRRPEVDPWYYEIVDRGYNHRMTDLQAALGLSQLSRLDRFLSRRTEIAERYRYLLADAPVVLPPEAPAGSTHALHLYPIRVQNRRQVYDGMHASGIGVQVHYVPLHHHPVNSDLGYRPSDLPACETAYRELLSLPIFPGLTDEDQDFVVASLRSLL